MGQRHAQTGLTRFMDNNPNLPSHSCRACWVTRRSHPGPSPHRGPLWPPSCCQLSWMGTGCGGHASGHNAHDSSTDFPGSTGCNKSPHCQEKVTQIKSMYLCVIKRDAARSSHHPHHGAVCYLQCSPQHSNHTALGLAGQEHLLCHTSQGMGWR